MQDEQVTIPVHNPEFPSRIAVITCDQLAFHLQLAGASKGLISQVQQLSKDIRHELGPVS